MAGRYLLDTNAVTAMTRGDAAIREVLAEADEILICPTVFGELIYGAEKSQRVAENLETFERIASDIPSLPCNLEVARCYGRLKNELRKKGRPIPENDLWIAATAQHHELVVLTRDHHFDELESVRKQRW